jgi:NADH-quinone oxidoreductase subunit N
MTLTDVYTILPLIVIAAAVLVLMLIIAFYRNHLVALLTTLIGLAIAFITLGIVAPTLPRQVTALIIMDGFAIFYMGLLIVAGAVVAVYSYDYLERSEAHREEFYMLLLLAILGSAVLVASNHFASFLLGLEILSIALYAMIAYPRLQIQRIEAGIKYLILAGATAAFLLLGMALVYTEMGTLQFTGSPVTEATVGDFQTILLIGWGLMTVGLGFKLALVPFHIWTPDVYQGAPAPVTGFIATVSKAGVFALMLRYFIQVDVHADPSLWGMFAIIAVASMLIGNFLALLQNSVKRILAYSSIAHLGYLMVAFLATGVLAQSAVAFYFVAYFLTTLSAFGVITLISTPDREIDQLEDYRGLFWHRRWAALVLAIAMLSLAGIPPSVGLIGKIVVAAAGIQSALWFLLIILVTGSVIGVFYYLRVVITMFQRPVEEPAIPLEFPPLSRAGGAILGILAVLVVGLGLYPVPVFRIIEAVVNILS